MSHGGIAPKTSGIPGAQGVNAPEGPSEPSTKPHTRSGHDGPGEEGEHLAGLLSRGASEEDGPETWDLPRPSRRNEPAMRGAGDPTPIRLASADAHESGPRTSIRAAGSPMARGTGAEDDGGRGPVGCVVVMTPGNG